MYILLLCMRYLRTRYLALACIISVMLGVATLIVVNSVMNGFSTKLRHRLHSLLSDVVIEAQGLEGFTDPEEKMARIRQTPLNEHIEAMSPTMEVFAMAQYVRPQDGQRITRTVHLVGIDCKTKDQTGQFKQHLVNSRDLPQSTFELSPDLQKSVAERLAMVERRNRAEIYENQVRDFSMPRVFKLDASGKILDPQPPGYPRAVDNVFKPARDEKVKAPEAPPPSMARPSQPTLLTQATLPKGAFVGHLIASYRFIDPMTNKLEERFVLSPGSDITLITVGGVDRVEPVCMNFVVADYFKSDMSEYDSNYIYVPLEALQEMRHMPKRVSSIQIKLKDYENSSKEVKEALENLFRQDGLIVSTWEDKQGPLLSAISVEKGILNILLFLIIAVAGFGILAIFSMIVAEKTRDIGILKALGASNGGVMKIFLGYGLLLGVVGAMLGTTTGVWITVRINDVERFLSDLSGRELFPRHIYYFNEIPTDIQPLMVLLVNLGAVLIAVTFSVLPALKAALLHPVKALRYE